MLVAILGLDKDVPLSSSFISTSAQQGRWPLLILNAVLMQEQVIYNRIYVT